LRPAVAEGKPDMDLFSFHTRVFIPESYNFEVSEQNKPSTMPGSTGNFTWNHF
jgi:hypothetical protein